MSVVVCFDGTGRKEQIKSNSGMIDSSFTNSGEFERRGSNGSEDLVRAGTGTCSAYLQLKMNVNTRRK